MASATVPVCLTRRVERRRRTALRVQPERRLRARVAARQPGGAVVRCEVWAELDSLLAKRELSAGGEAEQAALALVRTLQAEGVLRLFGEGRLVPRRDYTLADLRLHGIQADRFLAPRDSTLETVRTQATAALALGLLAVSATAHPDTSAVLFSGVAATAAVVADQVAGGKIEAVALDFLGRTLRADYRRRVVLHEAGHFLAAYLLGVLPAGYCLSAFDAMRGGAPARQAGVSLCDSAFNAELAAGSISSTSLDRYACIALAGVAAEYCSFGMAEGGLQDVRQLDSLLTALAFSQKRADSTVRYAALSTVLMLRRHSDSHLRLARAMEDGLSVAACIAAVEEGAVGELADSPLL